MPEDVSGRAAYTSAAQASPSALERCASGRDLEIQPRADAPASKAVSLVLPQLPQHAIACREGDSFRSNFRLARGISPPFAFLPPDSARRRKARRAQKIPRPYPVGTDGRSIDDRITTADCPAGRQQRRLSSRSAAGRRAPPRSCGRISPHVRSPPYRRRRDSKRAAGS